MKSVTEFKNLNKIPVISISHKGLEAIKEIVRIAPQEAQWFHTVEPVVYKQSPDEIHLHLSEKIYIPKQNTSAAQVDSTSSMMIEFYNELKQEYEDQNIVNQKLNAMTCWCHSHHNMSPNPSGQDDLQFNQFVNLSLDQQTATWQVMLIFNKKDQFYSRVYDPNTGHIYEGVTIHVTNDYDFSYIHKAAKEKFLKPKPKFPVHSVKNFSYLSNPIQGVDTFSNFQAQYNINESLAEDFVLATYPKATNDLHSARLRTKKDKSIFKENIMATLDEHEMALFKCFLTQPKTEIKKVFKDILNNLQTGRSNYFKVSYEQYADEIVNYLNATTDTIQNVKYAFYNAISAIEYENMKDFNHFIKDL
jgi:hypothetical protein